MNSILFVLIAACLFNSLVYSLKLASSSDFERDDSLVYTKMIQFFKSKPTKKDENRCSYIKLDKSGRQYITEIQPISDKKVAHHMTLFGCSAPPKHVIEDTNTNTWDCGSLSVCGHGELRRLFTWALNANGVKYPDGVGVRVGGDTLLDYLVVQVHYKDLPEEEFDSHSSYNLTFTSQELPYQVGIYNLGNNGVIPPKRESCIQDAPFDMVPLFYRTHAHNIVTVMSIYNINKQDEWIELGRMSPHQPQAFYPVTTKDQIIEKYDIIAARCTINSMDRDVITGSRHEDEMCAFYLMFYTDYPHNIYDFYCYKNGNKFKWQREIYVKTSPPENASSLEGVELLEPENEVHHHR